MCGRVLDLSGRAKLDNPLCPCGDGRLAVQAEQSSAAAKTISSTKGWPTFTLRFEAHDLEFRNSLKNRKGGPATRGADERVSMSAAW